MKNWLEKPRPKNNEDKLYLPKRDSIPESPSELSLYITINNGKGKELHSTYSKTSHSLAG